jgi:hypothetical protein
LLRNPGRYRSTAHMVVDIKYILDNMLVKKLRAELRAESEKVKLLELHNLLQEYLDGEFTANFVM